MRRVTILLFATFIPLLLLAAQALKPSEEVVKAFEEAGCTNCHNNVVAPDLQGTIARIEEWASKYKSLDEAVANEYKRVDTYDKMMEQMRKYTPGMTEEQYKLLYQFFKKVFEEAKTKATSPTTPVTTQKIIKPRVKRHIVTPLRLPTPNPSVESEPVVRTALPIAAVTCIAGVAAAAIIAKRLE